MPKEVQQLVEETLEKLKTRLTNENPDQGKAAEIIKECFKDAFSEVEEEDHKTLYKKLAMKFHPDKFANMQPEVFAILAKLEIADFPMKELGNYQEYKPNVFENVAADPVNGTKDFLGFLWEIIQKMESHTDRYPQPFKLMAHIVHWTITITLLGALIGAGILLIGIYFGVIWPVLQLESLFVNLISDSRYDIEIQNFKEPGFAAARKQYLDTMRTLLELMGQDMEGMSDEQLYNTLVNTTYVAKLQSKFPFGGQTAKDEEDLRQEVENEIKANIYDTINDPTGFEKIAMQAKVMADSIASDLPDSIGASILQVIFVKPLQVLITPVVLAASLLIETARYLHTAAIFIAIGAALAAKMASIFILNLPLYIIDSIEYMVNACSEGCTEGCTAGSEYQQKPDPEQPGLKYSQMKGLFGSQHGSEALVPPGKPEPAEQGSYVKILKPVASNNGMFEEKPTLPQATM